MEIIKLKITTPNLLESYPVISEVKEFSGLLWSLHCNHCPTHELSLHVECYPTDKEMLLKCEAQISFKALDNFIGPAEQKLTIRHSLMTEDIFKSEIYHCPNWSDNPDQVFEVSIEILSFELFPNYSFDFKDDKITDITLIVGEKKLYCSKQILALNSKKLYGMIYDRKKENDRLEICDTSYPIFHRFLEVLHGFDRPLIDKKNILEFLELSQKFKSKRCLRYCEASFFQLDRDREELANGISEANIYVKQLFQKWNDSDKRFVKFKKGMQEIEPIKEPSKIVHIDGVPFQIFMNYDLNPPCLNQKAIINCLYKDSCDLWKVIVEIHQIPYYSFRPTGSGDLIEFTSTRTSHYMDMKYGDRIFLKMHSIFRRPYPNEKINFGKPRKNLTDVVLSVGDKKYHVSRQILANASSYFYNMFYAGYQEQDKTDIPLIGIDKDGFEEFLQHVYNPKRIVEKSNFEVLLEYSQFYTATGIHEKCVEYILFHSQINDAQKILLCVEHNLDDVLKTLISRIKRERDFISLSKLDGFDRIDAATLARIKQNMANG